LTQDGRCAD